MVSEINDRVFSIRALAACCALSLSLLAGGTGECSQVLSLGDCISIAEANHPNIAGAGAQIAAQRGRLEQNVASDRLEISGSANVSRNGSAMDESTSYSLGATASVKLYDANRNKYSIDASKHTLSAAEAEALRTASEVRSNVKSAFMTLLLNAEIENQRTESVRAFEQRLEQAKGFYETGTKPWYDVTKAEVDLGNAQMSLVEATSNIRTAKAALANAMGIDTAEEFEISPSGVDMPDIPDAESEAKRLAIENRPDYRASELKIMAGRSSLSAEARSSSPTISLTGGYNGAGDDIFDLERGWNTGIRLSAPIVDGGAAKARMDVAAAQIMSLESSHEKLRQDIMLEVSKAITDITKARERIRISELTLISALENKKMAVGRYETGIGDPLEVTDALLSFTDAQLASKQAGYDLRIAMINLERATGVEFIGGRTGE
jgi:outer membrane protein TolC